MSGTVDLESADARLIGEEGAALSLSTVAGDTDGDGLADLLYSDSNGADRLGVLYLLTGYGL